MFIPEAVAGELLRRPGSPGGGVVALDWVERLTAEPADVRRVASGPPASGPGEREVIALALRLGAVAVIDDRRGRERARRLGASLTGTLGVLVALHLAGHARRRFEEDLDTLEESGMYLTPDLRRRVVDRLGARGEREGP